MKKLLLILLAAGCVLLTSCGVKKGNVTITNDSDLIVREIVFQDDTHSSYEPRVYSVTLNPGEVWEKSFAEATYTIVCEVIRDTDKYLGCSKEIVAGDLIEIKVSELKTGYYKIVR